MNIIFKLSKNGVVALIFLAVFIPLLTACGDFGYALKKDNSTKDNLSLSDNKTDNNEPADKDNSISDNKTNDNTTVADNETLKALFKPFDSKLYHGRSLLQTEDERKAYDLILQKLLDFEKDELYPNYVDTRLGIDLFENNIKSLDENQITKVLRYLDIDEPRLFHLDSYIPRPQKTTAEDTSKGYNIEYVNGKRAVVNFYVRLSGRYKSYADYKDKLIAVSDNSSEIIQLAKAGTTTAKKVRIAHDEFLKRVAYGGMNSPSAGNLVGAFVDVSLDGSGRHVVVCEGYSHAYNYILKHLGITAVYVAGSVREGAGWSLHAWSKVNIDDKWYSVDTTWDDALVIGGSSTYKYFMKSDSDFTDHIENVNNATDSKVWGGYLDSSGALIKMPASAPSSMTAAEYQ